MTQDKSNITNPTLTEDDFSINQTTDVLTNKPIGYYIMLMKSHLTKEEAEQLKQQILTALDQYPKLKEALKIQTDILLSIESQNPELKFDELVIHTYNTEQENKKLKAENEELKKKLEAWHNYG